MNEYVRPSVPERVYRDESGAVIRYGDRWGFDSPPEDSYSHTSNLDRFEPLHQVADALIEHLVSTYEVTAACVEFDDTDWNCSTLKAVRLTPVVENAASLLFRFTDYPSVELDAGLSRKLSYPRCSCDACDETWETFADELEVLVLAVAAGRFNERIGLPASSGAAGQQGTVSFDITDRDGMVVRASESSAVITDDLRATAALLDARPERRWQPWGQR